MDRGHQIKLDNAVFEGRLRVPKHSSGYVRRPTPQPARRVSDIHSPRLKNHPQPVQSIPKQSFHNIEHKRQAQTVNDISAPSPHAFLWPTQTREMFENWLSVPEEKIDEPASQTNQKNFRRSVRSVGLPNFSSGFSRAYVIYAMAFIVFAAGLYVSFSGAKTNNVAEAQIKKISQQSTQNQTGGSPAPDTTKPTPAQINSYRVSADFPRYLDIPFIGVHARILQTTAKPDGSLGTPANVYDTAWYTDSSKPGQPGAMLVDGHISSWTTKGVFYNLDKLVKGNTISITRGDGKTFDYTIVKTETLDAKKVNMANLLVSQDTSKPGLNLISCSGDVIPGTNEFNKRIVVYAVLN